MATQSRPRQILVTGGAGYVGAVLVPKLLQQGHRVKVLDLYLYGHEALAAVKDHAHLEQFQGDLRDEALLKRAMQACDTVIHLACISNDPSFELDPTLGKSINYDAFLPLVRLARDAGVRRFIYASSSSVYGIKDEPEVTEDLSLEPLTDYSRFKMMCEQVLADARRPGFETLTIRPATVCGYSPRQRLDLIVNIFTHQAVLDRRIRVFGGQQRRPNLHIQDMSDLYVRCVEAPSGQVDGQIFNAGADNHAIQDIASLVRSQVGEAVSIELTESDDRRSYHISSRRLADVLSFVPRHTIADAARELIHAFEQGMLPDSRTDSRYYNIRKMQELHLT